MKGFISKAVAGAALIGLTACSGMQEIAERENYAEPRWYAKCAESGTEGLLWWKEDMVYACGGGQSRYFQAAEEQMYAIAMNQFAKRLNGNMNSSTSIEIVNDTKNTRTYISYSVTDTAIREHIAHERAKFKYQGEYYTFVRLKMSKEIFDRLLAEAKQNGNATVTRLD
jgi:hypothetical protein